MSQHKHNLNSSQKTIRIVLSLLIVAIIIITGGLFYQSFLNQELDEAEASSTNVTLNVIFDPLGDADSDGIPNGIECGNNDGINCVNTDSQIDNIPDYLDTDSDNDGIPDSIERGNTCQTLVECVPFDTNKDSIPDFQDPFNGQTITEVFAGCGKPGNRPCILRKDEITYNQDIISPERYRKKDLEIAVFNLPTDITIATCSIRARPVGTRDSAYLDIQTSSNTIVVDSNCQGNVTIPMQIAGGPEWQFEIKITDTDGIRYQANPNFALSLGASGLVTVSATFID